MKHLIHKTTNLINGKYYIGKHSTENENDSYLGSDLSISKAIKKYGAENFKKVSIEGVVYKFISSAAKELNVSRTGIKGRCENSLHEDYYYI